MIRSISIAYEVVSKYYGGPKPTKKYVHSNIVAKNQQSSTFGNSQMYENDYGDYSKIAKGLIKTKESSTLPESYEPLKKGGYIYYRGKLLNEYELVEEAVRTKAITIDENMNYVQARNAAQKALIMDRATPRYGWSSTLYSEDGMYVIRVNEKGERDGLSIAMIDGVHIADVAARMASGELNENIETAYLSYLRQVDPELFEAASNIGREVRAFTIMADLYKNGLLTEEQFGYDCVLFAMLFSPNKALGPINGVLEYFNRIKASGDWHKLLEDYRPEAFLKINLERNKA